MAAVDVEDESILVSVFKDSFPENWRENPDFATYLLELSSYGVERLNREPERLSEERAQILQQTRELAFSNYKTFIRTADCTKEIYRDFGRVELSLSKLLDKLPSFGEKCRSVPNQIAFLSPSFLQTCVLFTELKSVAVLVNMIKMFTSRYVKTIP